MNKNVNLAVDIAGIKMQNPVATASGTFGFGNEYADYVDLSRLGALVVKGTTLHPRQGNPPPRIEETPCGILNAIGLQNPGIETVVNEILPHLQNKNVPVIVNISGDTPADYAKLAQKLNNSCAAGIEVNISCPNVKKGGLQFGSDPESAAEVAGAVKASTNLPVIIKLSPNVSSIVKVAEKVARAGADALSMINTLLGMKIDINTMRPSLGNNFGGLSGPAVKPVAVRSVWQVYREIDLPIIGIGGITTAEDALEFIMAGASVVAVGTGNFINPTATMDIIENLEKYLIDNDIADIKDLIGRAH
ncbi:MAG: dihydroorotate dehydrogenase [Clostridiales bacterium]|nr:dihydroorotate dehydrogenase [Clostridiales bacterium]MCF8022749.1 dihydroorotate dehydrogenase [Clostridiales bacterium]